MLTAVSGVERQGQTSFWAARLLQANEALAQDTETAVVWQKSGLLGPQAALLLPSSVTLGKSLGKKERKHPWSERSVLSRTLSSVQFIREGDVLILRERK